MTTELKCDKEKYIFGSQQVVNLAASVQKFKKFINYEKQFFWFKVSVNSKMIKHCKYLYSLDTRYLRFKLHSSKKLCNFFLRKMTVHYEYSFKYNYTITSVNIIKFHLLK